MKLRKTRITTETRRVVVVRRRRVVRFWCGEGGEDSEFVPLEDLNGLLEDGAMTPTARLSAPNFTSPRYRMVQLLCVSSRCQWQAVRAFDRLPQVKSGKKS